MAEFRLPLGQSKNEYKLSVLPDGLKILFISSPNIEYFSMAVSIRSGSLNDPPDLPGLAHLCEHMLFTGTKQYPKSGHFYTTLAEAGGDANAFTTGILTNYFMEIPINSIKRTQLVDNFTSFFENPLFKKNGMMLEIIAIEEEHALNRTSKLKILYYGMKLVADDSHPFTQFYTGNIESLYTTPKRNGIPVRKRLEEYFCNHYTLSNISLVVQGPEPLDLLQKQVKTKFSSKKPVISSIHDFAFPKHQRSKCLWVQNDTASCIRIFYSVHCDDNKPKLNLFLRVWTTLLGDEARGTVCEYLMRTNLIVGLTCHVQALDYNEQLLVVDITPSHRGYLRVSNIAHIILEYILSITDHDLNSLGVVLEEKSNQEKTSYNFRESQESCMNELSGIAETLALSFDTIKTKNIIRGYDDWDDIMLGTSWTSRAKEFVTCSGKILEPGRMNLIIMGKKNPNIQDLYGDHIDSGVHPQFDFEYERHYLNPKLFQENTTLGFRRDYSRDSSQDSNQSLFKQVQLEQSQSSSKILMPSSQPVQCLKLPNLEMWTDSYEEVSGCKVRLSFQILFTTLSRTAKTDVMLDLLSNIIGNTLRHELYKVEELGVEWSICPNLNYQNSLSFNVSGLKDFIQDALKLLLDGTLSIIEMVTTISNTELRRARTQVRHCYDEFGDVSGLKQVLSVSYYLFEPAIHSLDERIEILEVVDICTIQKFCNHLKNSLKYLKVLMSGFVDEECVQQTYRALKPLLTGSQPFKSLVQNESISLGGRSLSFKIPSPNTSTTTMIFCELGNKTDPIAVMMSYMIGFLLATAADRELRMEKCLGYYVDAAPQMFSTSVGIRLAITSSFHSSTCLEQHIRVFLKEWSTRLSSYTAQEFDTIKNNFTVSYVDSPRDSTLTDPPSCPVYRVPHTQGSSNIGEGKNTKRHRHNWGKIVTGNYHFGGKFGEEEVSRNKVINLESSYFIEFVKDKLLLPSALTVLGESSKECNINLPKRSWLRRSFDFKKHTRCYQESESSPLSSIVQFNEVINDDVLSDVYGLYTD